MNEITMILERIEKRLDQREIEVNESFDLIGKNISKLINQSEKRDETLEEIRGLVNRNNLKIEDKFTTRSVTEELQIRVQKIEEVLQ